MKRGVVLAVTALLAGCASLRPPPSDSQQPIPVTPLPAQFRISDAMERSPATIQTKPTPLISSSPVATGGWWKGLNEPIISALVETALKRNTDIEAAISRIAQSRALLARTIAADYPRVELTASAQRNRASLEDPARPAIGPRTTSRWSAGAAVTWEADLFGRRDAERRAAAWRVDERISRESAVQLAVVADVVDRAFELAELNEQLKLAAEALATDQDLITLALARVRGGQDSQESVFRVQTQRADTLSTVAQLRLKRADALASLALLIAATPDDAADLVGDLKLLNDNLQTPPLLAPSEMLLNRPDVQAAAYKLRATSADLAATAANRYPRFDIAATLGWIAATASGVGSASALAASVLPQIKWQALDFGDLEAQLEGRRADERLAVIEYKATVTRAFAEAQSALLQLQDHRKRLAAALEGQNSQRVICEIRQARYAAGLSELAPALEACKELNKAEVLVIESRRSELAGWVLVHKALGTDVGRIATK